MIEMNARIFENYLNKTQKDYYFKNKTKFDSNRI